jgi:hypothetical protein
VPSVAAFTSQLSPETEKIEKDLNETRFSKVAQGRIEWAETNHSLAKQSVLVDKWDDVFDKIEITKSVLYELSLKYYIVTSQKYL